MVGSQVMKSYHKKSILSCCPNEVCGVVRSTSVSFAINLCAQSMSYQNQHSLSPPYWNFLLSSNFLPTWNLSHCCFCFHSTDLQQYNQLCFLSDRRKWKEKHFIHKKRTYNLQINNKNANSLTASNLSFKNTKFA